jgi:hypothetical protein
MLVDCSRLILQLLKWFMRLVYSGECLKHVQKYQRQKDAQDIQDIR